MATTYDVISTQTLGTAIADIYFTSIPQTYTDLVLVVSSNTSAFTQTGFRVNSDNASNYSWTELYGTGAATATYRTASNSYARVNNYGTPDTTGRDVMIANFMNYSNTTTYKTIMNRYNNAGGGAPGSGAAVNLWRSTSAITSINFLTTSGANFAVGSTFTLYGIKAA